MILNHPVPHIDLILKAIRGRRGPAFDRAMNDLRAMASTVDTAEPTPDSMSHPACSTMLDIVVGILRDRSIGPLVRLPAISYLKRMSARAAAITRRELQPPALPVLPSTETVPKLPTPECE
jgi:hypothetical protein